MESNPIQSEKFDKYSYYTITTLLVSNESIESNRIESIVQHETEIQTENENESTADYRISISQSDAGNLRFGCNGMK